MTPGTETRYAYISKKARLNNKYKWSKMLFFIINLELSAVGLEPTALPL